METITFLENEVHALYAGANEAAKALLEKKYGKEFFSEKEWKELFSNFCKANNLTITNDASIARTQPSYVYLPHAEPANSEEEHDNASRMIRTIIAHNNKEKSFKVNYKDKTQRRYFPIFENTPSGLVFSYTICGIWNACSNAVVGAPFVSPTSDDAARIAKQYLPIYIKYLQTQ